MRLLPTSVLCVFSVTLWACSPAESPKAPHANMANPASVACINAGGSLSIQSTEKGEVGMCTLPSGKVCEEWALFRGECS